MAETEAQKRLRICEGLLAEAKRIAEEAIKADPANEDEYLRRLAAYQPQRMH